MPDLPFVLVVAAIVVNVVAMMTVGVASLLATAAEEQGVVRRQSALLQQTQAKLARMERLESLGRLAGGVAHDFNNVLAAIKLSAQSGAIAPQHVQKDADFAEIERATAHGAALVHQLLSFARQQPENVREFDANNHIAKLTGMLERLAGRVEVRFDAAPGPAMVSMDPSQFDQVVLNLVVNARDAMPDGGRVIVSTTVNAARPRGVLDDHDDATRFVCVVVEDTGTGIPADILPHIFEPFYSTKPTDRSTGLGLPTVQSIVHRAEGDVRVSSRQGRGTRFEVYLPAAG
jgi:signal transduction histidine kinase